MPHYERHVLSIYVVDEDERQVDRVVAAIALTRDVVATVDIAVAPQEILDAYGILHHQNLGTTPDAVVNHWQTEGLAAYSRKGD